jgi:Uma2 family endonuclease
VIHGVSWDEYDALLAAIPERRLPHTYDRGTLEIMSPSKPHEWIKKLIGRMVEAMTLELNVPIQSVGSTTLRRELSKRGLEPDDSYYIANELQVRGKDTLDLETDPPPDLVIEVDVTSSCLDRLDVYAKLRVPEIWRHDGGTLTFLVLHPTGDYRPQASSLAFPLLKPGDIQRFLDEHAKQDENSIIRAFLEWVRRHLIDQPKP